MNLSIFLRNNCLIFAAQHLKKGLQFHNKFLSAGMFSAIERILMNNKNSFISSLSKAKCRSAARGEKERSINLIAVAYAALFFFLFAFGLLYHLGSLGKY